MQMNFEQFLPFLGMVAITSGTVAIKVAQQLNVVRGYFVRAFFTSYVFTAFEGITVGIYAKTAFDGDWLNLLFLGTGSALGGVFAMWIYHKNKNKK